MKDDSEDDLTAREIETLDRLIRESQKNDAAERPDDAVLLRYAQGVGSAEEVARVQDALGRSRRLRQEVAYLASLYDPEAEARFDAVKVPARDHEVPWRRAKGSGKRRWTVPAISMAAAASIFVTVWLVRSDRGVRWTEDAQLDPGAFQHDVYRGPDESGFPEPSDPAEAATIAFMRVAEWKDGSLHVGVPSVPPETGRNVSVSIGAERYTMTLPPNAHDLELWYLAVPALRTFRLAFDGDELKAQNAPESSEGLLTISYRIGERFQAATPRHVHLR